MKITSKTTNKKYLRLTVVVAIIIILGAGGYLYATGFFSPSSSKDQTNYGKPSKEQIKAGENIEKETEETSNEGSDPNAVGSDRTPLPTGTTENKGTASVTISSFNQNDGIFQIRAFINTITNDGTCTLTMTKDGKTITKTAGVQGTPSATTCKGFDIPVSELSQGQWNAVITFENSTLKGTGSSPVKVL